MKKAVSDNNIAVFENIRGFLQAENTMPSTGYYRLMHEDKLHFHKVVELGFCRKGRGTSTTEDLVQDFREGDIQIVFPFQRHMNMSEKADNNEECIWKWSFFDPVILAQHTGNNVFALTKIMESIHIYGIIKKDTHPEIYDALYDLICEAHSGNGKYHLQKAYAMLSLALICMAEKSAETSHVQSTSAVKIPKYFHLIAEALIVVNQRIADGEQPTVDELARTCKMPLSSFRRTFSDVMGVSPKKHITSCAVGRSKTLLSMTDKSIAEIAGDCGFSEISTFNRAFKAVCGTSPNEYRRIKKELLTGK